MKEKGNVYVLAVGVLGVAKLLLDGAGYPIITDEQVNLLADGIAALAAIVAAYMNNHRAKEEEVK